MTLVKDKKIVWHYIEKQGFLHTFNVDEFRDTCKADCVARGSSFRIPNKALAKLSCTYSHVEDSSIEINLKQQTNMLGGCLSGYVNEQSLSFKPEKTLISRNI